MNKAETTLLQSGGIYTIRNMVSGRVYVGAARQFGERWRTFHVPATSVSNQAPSNATGAGVDQFSS